MPTNTNTTQSNDARHTGDAKSIAYLDCPAGVCGSMLLGALLDAGLDQRQLQAGLESLRISAPRTFAAADDSGKNPAWQAAFRAPYRPDFRLECTPVLQHGIGATRVRVLTHDDHPERNLHDIKKIISHSDLPALVQDRALLIFRKLAEAEAKIHRTSIDAIHFHEVGAIDAIIDIVGSVLGLYLLGVEQIFASPVNTGSGFVRCAHGLMPVPAPATAELLKGVPTYSPGFETRDDNGTGVTRTARIEKELTTPTGAAILAGLAEGFGGQPPMIVTSIGYGAGEHQLPIPNVLRILIGHPVASHKSAQVAITTNTATNTADSNQATPFERDQILSLECTLDDANPEWIGHLFDRLYADGALEVFLTPVQTKKNRPAVVCTILCELAREHQILERLFRESTTLGVRRQIIERRKLQRELRTVETEYGPVTVKFGTHAGQVYNIAPEFESGRAIAERTGRPIKTIYAAALRDGKSSELS